MSCFIRFTLLTLLAALTGCTTLKTLYPGESRWMGEPHKEYTLISTRDRLPTSAIIASEPQWFADKAYGVLELYQREGETEQVRKYVFPGQGQNHEQPTVSYPLDEIKGEDGALLATNAEVYLSVYNLGAKPARSRLVFMTRLPGEDQWLCGTLFIGINAFNPKGSFINPNHDDFFCFAMETEGPKRVEVIPATVGLDQDNMEYWSERDPAAGEAVAAACHGRSNETAAATRLTPESAAVCNAEGKECRPRLLHHAVKQGDHVALFSFGRRLVAENAHGTSANGRYYARAVTCPLEKSEG